jgi:hypothetical protein
MTNDNSPPGRMPPLSVIALGLMSTLVPGWAVWSSNSIINQGQQLAVNETTIKNQTEDIKELKEMISLLLQDRGITFIPKANPSNEATTQKR